MISQPKFKNQTLLVLLLVGAQSICLLAGIFLFSNLTRQRLQASLTDAIQRNNQQIAHQAAVFCRELGIGAANALDWHQQSALLEKIRVPNNGSVCLFCPEKSRIACQKQFEKEWETYVSKHVVKVESTLARGELSCTLDTGTHLVAIERMPESGLLVLAVQNKASVFKETEATLRPVFALAYVFVLIVVCLTAAAATVVIGRYEHRLSIANRTLEKQIEQRTKSLKRTRNATIFGLAKLAESRDTDTGDHLDRIRSFVTILAKGLQGTLPDLSNEYIDTLGVASSLHDIGKVGIPDAVLLKPSRLDTEERAVMETHAELGAECIAAIIERLGEDDFLTVAHEIALWHHEKYDGTGYPTNLKGNEIPISARIVALADVYDALISPRVYKRPMTHQQAREIILEGAGQHFDPTIVSAFLDRESEFIEITERLHASIEESAPVQDQDRVRTSANDKIDAVQPPVALSTRP